MTVLRYEGNARVDEASDWIIINTFHKGLIGSTSVDTSTVNVVICVLEPVLCLPGWYLMQGADKGIAKAMHVNKHIHRICVHPSRGTKLCEVCIQVSN